MINDLQLTDRVYLMTLLSSLRSLPTLLVDRDPRINLTYLGFPEPSQLLLAFLFEPFGHLFFPSK